MTAFDRFEPQLPQLMDELAPARIPDYFDDLLRQTARTRQRSRWSSLERWLPMGVIARTNQARQVPWRPIVVAAMLIVLASVAVALIVGSRPAPAPPPFGPANNGSVLVSSGDGEILAVDLETGQTRALLSGDALDEAPAFAPDGRSFMFRRLTDEPGIWVADADGTGAHRAFDSTGYDLQTIEWSADSKTIVAMGGDPDLTEVILLIDPAGGAPRTLRPQRDLAGASMPFGRDQLIIRADDTNNSQFLLMDRADPTALVPLAVSGSAINEPALSPDGNRFVYSTWEDGLGTGGNLHVFDLDTLKDTLVTTVANDNLLWQVPKFMPDGKTILANRWAADGPFTLTLVPADGVGPDRPIGPTRIQDGGGATTYIAPDGKTVFAVYHDDGVDDHKIWSIDVATGEGHELPWPAPESLTWQRVGG
jgi:dipeptidyl aminopeptidase/acylaminoacyl peptidase